MNEVTVEEREMMRREQRTWDEEKDYARQLKSLHSPRTGSSQSHISSNHYRGKGEHSDDEDDGIDAPSVRLSHTSKSDTSQHQSHVETDREILANRFESNDSYASHDKEFPLRPQSKSNHQHENRPFSARNRTGSSRGSRPPSGSGTATNDMFSHSKEEMNRTVSSESSRRDVSSPYDYSSFYTDSNSQDPNAPSLNHAHHDNRPESKHSQHSSRPGSQASSRSNGIEKSRSRSGTKNKWDTSSQSKASTTAALRKHSHNSISSNIDDNECIERDSIDFAEHYESRGTASRGHQISEDILLGLAFEDSQNSPSNESRLDFSQKNQEEPLTSSRRYDDDNEAEEEALYNNTYHDDTNNIGDEEDFSSDFPNDGAYRYDNDEDPHDDYYEGEIDYGDKGGYQLNSDYNMGTYDQYEVDTNGNGYEVP